MRTTFRIWLALVIGAVPTFFGKSAHAQLAAQEMRLHVINVGQGEAILAEFPCAAALIDTGGEADDEFDSTDALMAYLDRFFRQRTDLGNRLVVLYLTHPHIDHTRGAEQVLAAYKPKNIVTNGQRTGSGRAGQNAAAKYAAESEASGKNVVGFQTVTVEDLPRTGGYTDAVIDPIKCDSVDPGIQVLWGAHRENPGWKEKAFTNTNNHSIVIRLDFGATSFLFSGDLEREAITEMVKRYEGTPLLDVDVYKVGHHGSENATTDTLLKAAKPNMAIMSMGPADRETDWTAWAYGHPRKSIIDLLQANVTKNRTPHDFPVATAVKTFVPVTIKKAIYATGWEGNLVLSAKTDGTVDVLAGADAPVAKMMDINKATAKDLTKLPSIGPKRAAAVVRYRAKHGPFKSTDDLTKVPGIGSATFHMVSDLVSIGQ